MTLDVNDLKDAIEDSLDKVIKDTFGSVFGDVGNQFSNLNGFDFTQFQNNIEGSFGNLISNINSFTSNLVNQIGNILNQPMQDLLTLGSFISFLTTIKLILLDNLSRILKLRVFIELAKPLIQTSIDLARELYIIKDPVFQALRIKLETKLQETIVRINMRKTKYRVRGSIEGFHRETNLKLNITKFLGWPLLLVSMVLFMAIQESRNEIKRLV